MQAISFVYVGLLIGVYYFVRLLSSDKLHKIPNAARSGAYSVPCAPLFRYLLNSNKVIQDGYEKFSIFKVPDMGRWTVIVRGTQFVEELRNAPNDVMSLVAAVDDMLQARYTLGPTILANPYHIPVCARLTRNLGVLYDGIHDEIAASFDDVLPDISHGWVKVAAVDSAMQVVCRTTNRAFVGLPLCRNAEWLSLNIDFTLAVSTGGIIINLFPNFLKPVAARFLTNVPSSIRTAMRHLKPLIEERRMNSGHDKSNDFLSWLMEKATKEESTLPALTRRILMMNFAAVHTTSMTFLHAFYELAANPAYADILRSEVDQVVKEKGWTLQAINKMRKVDSFLRESQRINTLGCLSMIRKNSKPFTFSDGTIIPEGTFLSVAATATHHDEAYYPNAEVFDPWRFSRLEKEFPDSRLEVTSPNAMYLPFGYGRHSCPGRFFAACEIKTMLAHIVSNYDVKFEDEGKRPPNQWFATHCIPDQKAQVLFRKRSIL